MTQNCKVNHSQSHAAMATTRAQQEQIKCGDHKSATLLPHSDHTLTPLCLCCRHNRSAENGAAVALLKQSSPIVSPPAAIDVSLFGNRAATGAISTCRNMERTTDEIVWKAKPSHSLEDCHAPEFSSFDAPTAYQSTKMQYFAKRNASVKLTQPQSKTATTLTLAHHRLSDGGACKTTALPRIQCTGWEILHSLLLRPKSSGNLKIVKERQHRPQDRRYHRHLDSKFVMYLLIAIVRLLFVSQLTTTTAATTASTATTNFHLQATSDYDTNSSSSRLHGLALALSGNNPLALAMPTLTPEQIAAQGSSIRDNVSSSQAPVVNDPHILKLINRDNVLRRQQHRSNDGGSAATSSVNSVSTCSSCHLREKAKQESLESIKQHILSQLRLPEFPNIAISRDIPTKILEDFYREQNNNRQQQQRPLSGQKSNSELKSDSSVVTEVMQGDDPRAYQQFDDSEHSNMDNDADHETEDAFYSRVDSIYLFPTMSRLRHNRKSELLNFKFENPDQVTIAHTIMHLYLRGRDWMAKYDAETFNQLKANGTTERDLVVSVHRAIKRSTSSNFTHTVQLAESRFPIPAGSGKWVQIELRDLSNSWAEGSDTMEGIVIKTNEQWMRPFVVSGLRSSGSDSAQNKAFTVHLEIRPEHNGGRHKRSISLDCQESDNEVRCCRYPLKVNFTSFGWSFVVAPTDFDAYFCNGECKLGYLEKYTHTHLASLTRSASPCCSPTQMSSLSLLYFTSEQKLVMTTIPNMTVEKCSCS